jgi:hypothetical protein
VKTVALKDIKTGGFTMCRLTGFGSISSDDRADYTSENKFTEYKNLADGKFGTKVSLGNFKTSLDLKETRIVTLEDDKVVKDSKISALEDDKAVKDTKIANLESDKNDKDNRVAALETDKNQKDTKMSTMESDMALLASQVSLGNVRVSLGNLATRVTSLETLGIQGISNAVSWTNLTEINVGGQTITSGGTVQAYAGGGLEKISGADGFNAGASSSQKIDGNSDGYVQFQIAQTGKDIKIGLVYADVDYADADPFEITFSGTDVSTDGSVRTTYAQGDFFRIRHYASSNEVKYQKRQTVYSQNPNFVFETASGSNYNYPSVSRPLVISLDGTGTLTIGELYEVYTVRASDQALYLRDLNGNAKGYHGKATRGVRFEVVEEAGQDYVSFQTSNTLTNGSDLYVDTSFYSVGARINDVTIVT